MSDEPESPAAEPDESKSVGPGPDEPVGFTKDRDQKIAEALGRSNVPGLVAGKVTAGLAPKDLGLGLTQAMTDSFKTDLAKASESIIKSSGIGEAMKNIIGMTVPKTLSIKVPEPFIPIRSAVPEYSTVKDFTPYIDPSPGRTADAAEQTAEYTRDLLNAMRDSLQLNEDVRQENAIAANFTRRVSIFSIVGTFASIGLGIASLVVALVALSHP